MTKRTKAYLALTVAVVIWGATLTVVKPALEVVSPVQFLFLRFLVVALLVMPFAVRGWRRVWPSGKTLATIAGLEFLGTPLALTALYTGLTYTTAVESTLLAATLPVFITLGGIYFLKERQERHEWIGLGLSLLGALLIVFGPTIGNGAAVTFSLTGNALVLLFVVLSAGYYLMAKRAYRDIPKLFISGASAFVAVPVFFIALVFTDNLPSIDAVLAPPVLIATLYSAIFAWLIAFSFYLYGQHLIEASEASIFKYLEGAVGIPVAWLLLGEVVPPLTWIAVGLVTSGVVIGSWRMRRKRGLD